MVRPRCFKRHDFPRWLLILLGLVWCTMWRDVPVIFILFYCYSANNTLIHPQNHALAVYIMLFTVTLYTNDWKIVHTNVNAYAFQFRYTHIHTHQTSQHITLICGGMTNITSSSPASSQPSNNTCLHGNKHTYRDRRTKKKRSNKHAYTLTGIERAKEHSSFDCHVQLISYMWVRPRTNTRFQWMVLRLCSRARVCVFVCECGLSTYDIFHDC